MEEKNSKRIFFGFSSARHEDVISRLPDSLISQILLSLPTKEAVRTSVLSNRWKSLWLLTPGLDLNSCEFSNYNAFASFIDRCLDFYREEKSCLHKLKLSIYKDENDDNQSCVTRWIDFVARRKLKHLDVECFLKRKCLEVIPISLFICETLVHLRLYMVLFGNRFEDSSWVSLPRLKTMSLELNVYANERSLESFISYCPMLEDLSIVRRVDDNVKELRVRSHTLTSLSIQYYLRGCRSYNKEKLGGLIEAPRLKYLDLQDEIIKSKTITNSGSLTNVNILGQFYHNDSSAVEVRQFFTSFLGVSHLKISFPFSKCITDKVSLPQFCYLSCLEANLPLFRLGTLWKLLASCPNLRSLILELMHSCGREGMRVSPVPLCLMSSLEFVEIKFEFNVDRILELVKYFAENSVVLKKLVLRSREENIAVLCDLHTLPRRSSKCQIVRFDFFD